MAQARRNPHQRIACGPAGYWYPIGQISQRNLPQPRGYCSETNMELISFNAARIENTPIDDLFEELRRKFWALGICPQFLEKRKEVGRGIGW